MSFAVVTKGPVASAGSMLYLFNTNGTNVPKSAAKVMTESSARLTVMLSPSGKFKIVLANKRDRKSVV